MWLVCVLLFTALHPAFCSRGDRSADFRSCVRDCELKNCSLKSGNELPLHLRVLAWSCKENCEYECMQTVTSEDVRSGRTIRQFHGKWPFVRLYGVQEPASVLFSILNGLTALFGYLRFKRLAADSYPYHPVITIQLWVNLNAWFWSTVFHSRDTYWTEKLDYFSAMLFIVSGVLFQFVRLTGPLAVYWHLVYGVLWVSFYMAHVSYLTYYKFDYGYNMAASVGVGILFAAIWVMWCLKNWRDRRYVWKCLITVVATGVLVLLELLDFPPLWWILDAHSLWHLSTVPLPLLWYSFLTDDANFESIHKMKKTI